MIVPMKKVSLIILEDSKEQTLKKLRKLGLVHIEITEGSGDKISAFKEKVVLLERSIFNVDDKANKETPQKEASLDEALSIAERIDTLTEEKKVYQAELLSLGTELERLKAWGNIDPNEFAYLKEKGIDISIYEMPFSEYEKIDNTVKTFVLSKTKSTVRILAIKEDAKFQDTPEFSIEAYRIELPKISTGKIKEQEENVKRQILNINEELASYSAYISAMKNAVSHFEKEIQFQIYATGMNNENLSENSQNNYTVSYFTGYIEAEKLDILNNAAKENAWGLLAEDPTEEDNVPTKLKNNKFVSLIYPLTDFLGTVPGYFEYDISGWFLGFILIFFGIIFGDGGYGLLISAVAAIPIIKSLVSKKSPSPIFLLVGLFGLSTILWGMLTCTWFGLSPAQLPLWLQKLSVPFISNVYADKIWYPFWTNGEAGLTTSQNLQIFCFSLALLQLTVAHIMGAIRNRKSVKFLGDIGSILQLIGIYYVVLTLVVNGAVFGLDLSIRGIPIGISAIVMIGLGFVMSFVFANYEGSIVKSILSSLKNIVSVLLGVVNVFSDIVSYIRLWAVGLAGAAISLTVNELAGPLLGKFMFMILAIILLVFGHGLNMILNVLSVIVHGIRLNTLEFSTHLDMSWSGHKYEPFKE